MSATLYDYISDRIDDVFEYGYEAGRKDGKREVEGRICLEDGIEVKESTSNVGVWLEMEDELFFLTITEIKKIFACESNSELIKRLQE